MRWGSIADIYAPLVCLQLLCFHLTDGALASDNRGRAVIPASPLFAKSSYTDREIVRLVSSCQLARHIA